MARKKQKQEPKQPEKPKKKLLTKKQITFILLFIFCFTLGIRLYYAFSTSSFSDDASYYHLRQIEHIKAHGTPLIHDELSYSGRTHIIQPVYHYVLALLALGLPMSLATKLVPNILAALLVIVVYLITKDMTQDAEAALFSAFAAGFIPIFFAETTVTLSAYALTFPLFFYMIYAFIKSWETQVDHPSPKQKAKQVKQVYIFIFLFLLLTLIQNITIIFLFALLIYFVLLKLEKLKREIIEKEIFLFSLFLFLWTQLIIHKKAFLMHGLGVIWQNIPEPIVDLYFKQVQLGSLIPLIGVVPILYGLYSIYYHLFSVKDKKSYLIISLIIASGCLLAFGTIKLEPALIMIGICLSILFSELYKNSFLYIENTRFHRYKKLLWLGFLIILIGSALIPSLYFTSRSVEKALSPEETDALDWLSHNTRKHDVVLAAPTEGNMIAALAQRKNVMDTQFLLIKDATRIFDDVRTMFHQEDTTALIPLLQKYDVDFVYLSRRARLFYWLKDFHILKAIQNHTCFTPVYRNKEVSIFSVECKKRR